MAFHLTSKIQAKYSNPSELLQLDTLMLNLVGRQEMLTQKISKEACESWSGNQSEDHLKKLQYSVDMFELGLTVLNEGHHSLPDARDQSGFGRCH